jgi:hypothetical protein
MNCAYIISEVTLGKPIVFSRPSTLVVCIIAALLVRGLSTAHFHLFFEREKHSGALRALFTAIFAALFLIASPSLRATVVDGITRIAKAASLYAPYSYLGLIVMLVGGLLVAVVRGSGPRPL